jgi:hypothetical protein
MMKALELSNQLITAFETVFLPKPSTQKTDEPSAWNTFWRQVVEGIIGNQEPQIWQEVDRHGQLYWHGYDPQSGNYFTSDSEAEMRVWVEQRYYQN